MKNKYTLVTINFLNKLQVPTKCKICNNDLIDFKDLENVQYHIDKHGKYVFTRVANGNSRKPEYIESKQNQWLIKGKTIDGITYRRTICWDCFFKKIFEKEDVARKARKGKWYGKLFKEKIGPIPDCSTSSAAYFSWLLNVPQEVLNKQSEKFKTASKSHWIKKYGKEEGLKKFNEYQKRQAYTASTEYFIKEKGMTEKEAKEFHANRACTEENFIKRYGKGIGAQKWKKYCEDEAYAGNKLEYFIEKYGNEEGLKKYFETNAKKALTKENFIAKYGEEEGIKRYNDLSNNRIASDISQQLFNKIDNLLGSVAINSKYESKNSEQCVQIINSKYTHSRTYRPDYSLDNKAIEFNGDYWHANPKIYSKDDLINGKIASVIWEHDRIRLAAIKELGYLVHVVWESDYRSNPDLVIQQCLIFLKN